ncbi:MAG: hypothetical protein KA170_02540 [Candidatus Promineofilum sp.]|nr:hypothetical protein [Promineifilum sp.]
MTPTILLIPGTRDWTRRAIHLAAAMAQEAGAAVQLTHMVPIIHLEYLGADNGDDLLSYAQYSTLCECIETAEAYGVAVRVEIFEYIDYSGGLKGAAERVSALAVFAPVPGGSIAPLRRVRLWALRRTLGRPLYTLDRGDGPLTWTEPPSASLSGVPPLVGVKRL